MIKIRDFDYFLKKRIVKRQISDKPRSENLFMESKRKFKLLQRTTRKMGINDENANDYVEDCYNILMSLIRSKMLENGYSCSGQGAHEAEVAYSKELGFKESEMYLLNKLRYFRNGILYYGKKFDKEYAKKIIKFTKIKFENLLEDK